MNQILQDELDIVKKLAGIKEEKRMAINDLGWVSRTYLVDDGRIVFKFPRSDAGRREYAREVPVLEFLEQQTFEVKIPIINWSTPNQDYIGYFGVLGTMLDQKKTDKLGEDQKIQIGTAIGLFLKQLHLLESPKGALIKTVRGEIEQFQAHYQKSAPALSVYVTSGELRSIENFFMKKLPDTMLDLGEEPVFCHGDLGEWNILLSDDDQIGIIDFGDAGLYDRSKDFIGLEDETIAESALRVYGESQGVRDKIKIRKKALPVLDLPYHINRHNEDGIKKCVDALRAGL